MLQQIPSGWGHVEAPGPVMKSIHYFYKKIQSWGSPYHPSGTAQQRKLQLDGHRFTNAAEARADKKMLEEVVK